MPRAVEARATIRAGRGRPRGNAAAGWGLGFAGAGLLAAVAGPAAQLGYAAAAILTVGLAHGASDAAVVPAGRRTGFVATYLLVVAGVLLLWQRSPVAALAGFLLLSAVHFGVEDAPADAAAERTCRGLALVAAPALLHRDALAGLFASLTDDPAAAADLARALAAGGAVAVLLLPAALASAARRDGTGAAARLAAGAGAAVLLPPFVGFTLAFVALHAWPQLRERMARTGAVALPAYLVRFRFVLAGAGAVIGAAGWLFADRALPVASTLFAGLAALAVPHMLVTPLFEAAPARPRGEKLLVPGG